MLHELSFHI